MSCGLKPFAILCGLFLSVIMANTAGAQEKIAIMGFTAFSPTPKPSDQLTELLMQKITANQAYLPVERKQIDQVVQEQKLRMSGLTESQGADTVGKILNIEKIIVGNITQWEGKYLITARLIDVKTGRVVACANQESKTLEFGPIADTLAQKLLTQPAPQSANEEIVSRIHRNLFTLGSADIDSLKKHYNESVLDALYDFWLESDRIQDTEIQESIILGKKIGQELGLPDSSLKLIELTLKLRRLGLLSLPKDVLQKETKLSGDEYTVLHYFPVATYNTLDQPAVRQASGLSSDMYRQLLKLVLYQRKNLDGSGYPDKVTIDKYPLESEITHLCLMWSALTHDRNWRKAMAPEKALEILKQDTGKQWSGKVYSAFFKHNKKAGNK